VIGKCYQTVLAAFSSKTCRHVADTYMLCTLNLWLTKLCHCAPRTWHSSSQNPVTGHRLLTASRRWRDCWWRRNNPTRDLNDDLLTSTESTHGKRVAVHHVAYSSLPNSFSLNCVHRRDASASDPPYELLLAPKPAAQNTARVCQPGWMDLHAMWTVWRHRHNDHRHAYDCAHS
jgi:hypothetical protein